MTCESLLMSRYRQVLSRSSRFFYLLHLSGLGVVPNWSKG